MKRRERRVSRGQRGVSADPRVRPSRRNGSHNGGGGEVQKAIAARIETISLKFRRWNLITAAAEKPRVHACAVTQVTQGNIYAKYVQDIKMLRYKLWPCMTHGGNPA